MHNRVHFSCEFHGKRATATLTLEDGGRFLCAFRLASNVIFPAEGRWQRAELDRLFLRTKHGFLTCWLQENPDHTLTGIAQRGGYADFNIVGVRSSALPRALPKSVAIHA